MLRVLHCIYDDPDNPWLGGGGARRVREIYSRLVGDVDATVASGTFPAARDGDVDGVRYRRLGLASPYALSRASYVAAANGLLARGDYDVAVYDYSVYTPLRLPRARRIGTVVHMLQGPTARERWGRLAGGAVAALERRLLKQSRAVCVTSEWLRRQLEDLLRPGTPVSLVGSGVPDELFDSPRDERSFLLYYGRFDVFQKGLDVLLDAFADLYRQRPELRLKLAGSGKDAGRLIPLARERGVADAVEVVHGVGPELRLELLSRATLVLHPSRFEGLPMVPAEAMAAGAPVIATDVGAVAEVIRPPEGGVLVPADDAVALARAIRQLLDDPPRRSQIGVTARESAARFRWDSVAADHLSFLNTLAADVAADPDTHGKI